MVCNVWGPWLTAVGSAVTIYGPSFCNVCSTVGTSRPLSKAYNRLSMMNQRWSPLVRGNTQIGCSANANQCTRRYMRVREASKWLKSWEQAQKAPLIFHWCLLVWKVFFLSRRCRAYLLVGPQLSLCVVFKCSLLAKTKVTWGDTTVGFHRCCLTLVWCVYLLINSTMVMMIFFFLIFNGNQTDFLTKSFCINENVMWCSCICTE